MKKKSVHTQPKPLRTANASPERRLAARIQILGPAKRDLPDSEPADSTQGRDNLRGLFPLI